MAFICATIVSGLNEDTVPEQEFADTLVHKFADIVPVQKFADIVRPSIEDLDAVDTVVPESASLTDVTLEHLTTQELYYTRQQGSFAGRLQRRLFEDPAIDSIDAGRSRREISCQTFGSRDPPQDTRVAGKGRGYGGAC